VAYAEALGGPLRSVWPQKSVEGEICLITGAGSGLGRLLALKMAEGGAKVAMLDINETGVKAAAGEVQASGGEAFARRCDVTDVEDVRAAIAESREALGGDITILVNNAGVVAGKTILKESESGIRRTMNVNVMAHFWTIRECLPSMLARNHGHVVTIASASGYCGVAGMCDYAASKWAAIGLDESLRLELRREGYTGVHTTCICPSFIDTGMFEGVKGSLLMPLLRPMDVVNATMTAVKRNTPVVNMPLIVHTGPMLRTLLPVWLFDITLDWMGISHAMNDFRGRSIEPAAASAKA
jgi:all-trans-retinol dehydrogenase (NAD+)